MPKGKNHTELLFVVDRSGSMASMVEPTISGYNEVLRENKGAEGTASVTLCLFDDEILFPYDHVDVAEVEPLDTSTYVPRGMTALLDAIGKTVSNEKVRQKAMPKEERPGKTIVVIITDGLENASREWDYASIRKLLGKVQGKKHHPWAVTFLGANIDVSREAARLGIRPERAKSYMADSRGYQTAYAGVAQMSAALRDSSVDFEDVTAMDAVYGNAFADLDTDYATRSGKANSPADDDDPANIEILYGPFDPLFDDSRYADPFVDDLEGSYPADDSDIDDPLQFEYGPPPVFVDDLEGSYPADDSDIDDLLQSEYDSPVVGSIGTELLPQPEQQSTSNPSIANLNFQIEQIRQRLEFIHRQLGRNNITDDKD